MRIAAVRHAARGSAPPLDRRQAARAAAAIYGGAIALNFGEALMLAGQRPSLIPGLGAVAAFAFAVVVGPRLPAGGIYLLGLLGAALIGVAVATTRAYGDVAVLYMWPTVWTAYFFGRRQVIGMVAWVGLVHFVALRALPDHMASPGRWIDVVVAVAVVSSITSVLSRERERLIRRLDAEAREDALTGLLNRRGLDERLGIEVARARRDGTGVALMMIDLDHFKLINDRYGHEMGDRVLAWVGHVLRAEVREGDIAARFGGEEFVVVLPRASVDQASATAERIRARIARADAAERVAHDIRPSLAVTISAGVVAARTPRADVLIGAADRGLYQAKAAGRDRVTSCELVDGERLAPAP